MPSFDIVSKVDAQEVDNAVNQTHKEISQRFDFRGGKSSISFERNDNKIKINADDELKLRSIHQILEQKMAKRQIDLRCLEYSKEEVGSGGIIKQTAELKAGIDKDNAKQITKAIRDSKLKVQAEIQSEQVRVTGKSIDDLQAVIQMFKDHQEIKIPLQFVNMRS